MSEGFEFNWKRKKKKKGEKNLVLLERGLKKGQWGGNMKEWGVLNR